MTPPSSRTGLPSPTGEGSTRPVSEPPLALHTPADTGGSPPRPDAADQLDTAAEVAAFYVKHQRRIIRRAERLLRTAGIPPSACAAEDLAMDAMTIILRRNTERHIEEPMAYISTVLRRLCIDLVRHRSMQARHTHMMLTGGGSLGDLPELDRSAEHTAVSNVQVTNILVALDSVLTRQEKTAFLLNSLYDLPSREIAEMMEMKAGSVRTLLLRARRKLQKYMEVNFPNAATGIRSST